MSLTGLCRVDSLLIIVLLLYLPIKMWNISFRVIITCPLERKGVNLSISAKVQLTIIMVITTYNTYQPTAKIPVLLTFIRLF